jgi:CRISPR type IV-associated protein Csf1
MSEATLATLAWQVAHDRPELELGGPGTCAWTGLACEETVAFAVSDNFAGWADLGAPWSDRAHPGCQWLAGSTGERSASGKRELRWCLFSLRASAQHGLERASKAEKPRIRQWLLDPPEGPWALCLAASGQKHLAYRTPINDRRDRYVVALETSLVEVEASWVRERLADVEACYRAGLTKAELGSGETDRLHVLADPDIRAAWARVRSDHRDRSQAIRLLVWVAAQRQTGEPAPRLGRRRR